LANNEYARGGPLDCPYGELSPAEQAKDAFWLSSARDNYFCAVCGQRPSRLVLVASPAAAAALSVRRADARRATKRAASPSSSFAAFSTLCTKVVPGQLAPASPGTPQQPLSNTIRITLCVLRTHNM